MQSKQHWERVYSTKSATNVSWFQAHADLSMKLIQDAKITTTASIIDVGGGASTLADDLLAHNYENITVLDLSRSALNAAQQRLGMLASKIKWIEGDVLDTKLQRNSYDVWHDRAVFHFLVNEQERLAYVRQVLEAVKPGGLVIVATFAEDGPTKCSGLPVMRYSANQLHSQFGEPFKLLGHEKELHHTPSGDEQKFLYCFCKKNDLANM